MRARDRRAEIFWQIKTKWQLSPKELWAIHNYLRGPQTCEKYDRLPPVVQVGIKEAKRALAIDRHENDCDPWSEGPSKDCDYCASEMLMLVTGVR